jgi:hypothetical protein
MDENKNIYTGKEREWVKYIDVSTFDETHRPKLIDFLDQIEKRELEYRVQWEIDEVYAVDGINNNHKDLFTRIAEVYGDSDDKIYFKIDEESAFEFEMVLEGSKTLDDIKFKCSIYINPNDDSLSLNSKGELKNTAAFCIEEVAHELFHAGNIERFESKFGESP